MKNITMEQVKAMTFGQKSKFAHKLAKKMNDGTENDYSARLSIAWTYIKGETINPNITPEQAINATLTGKKAEQEQTQVEQVEQDGQTAEQVAEKAVSVAGRFLNDTEKEIFSDIVKKETGRKHVRFETLKTLSAEDFITELEKADSKESVLTSLVVYTTKYLYWKAVNVHTVGTNHDAEEAIKESHYQEKASQWEKLTSLGLDKDAVTDTVQDAILKTLTNKNGLDHLLVGKPLTEQDIKDGKKPVTNASYFYGTMKNRVNNAVKTELNRRSKAYKENWTFTSFDHSQAVSTILEAQIPQNVMEDYYSDAVSQMELNGVSSQAIAIAIMKLEGKGVKDIAQALQVKDAKRHIEKARWEMVEKMGFSKSFMEKTRKSAKQA